MQLNGNLLFERAFGKADESGIPYSTNISDQWQAKYRWRPAFEYGLQGLGEMGKWNSWDAPADQRFIVSARQSSASSPLDTGKPSGTTLPG